MSDSDTYEASAPPASARGVGMVAFLFALAGRDRLHGPGLRGMLHDAGLSDAAARTLLSRMVRGGQLAAERSGRTATYRLAGSTARGFELIRRRGAGGGDEPGWDGVFHTVLHQVPERARAYRDALRRAATTAGYGVLQPGVLVAPADYREQLEALVERRPEGAHVVFGRLEVDPADARRVVASAWRLEELAATYGEHVVRLRRALEQPGEPEGGEALAVLALTVAPALSATLREPVLPRAYLPADWPGPIVRELAATCRQRFGPAAEARAHERLAR